MREGLFDHHRQDLLSLIADANQFAQGILGPVPEGYAWYVEAVGFNVVGNSHLAIPALAITPDGGSVRALNVWDGAGLLWCPMGTPPLRAGFSLNPALYVGPGHFVHTLASNPAGGTLAAGDQVVFTLQTAVHQLDPHFLMSPDDALQVKSAHERMAAELNQDAVGPRAN